MMLLESAQRRLRSLSEGLEANKVVATSLWRAHKGRRRGKERLSRLDQGLGRETRVL